jgi:hypothetical protein
VLYLWDICSPASFGFLAFFSSRGLSIPCMSCMPSRANVVLATTGSIIQSQAKPLCIIHLAWKWRWSPRRVNIFPDIHVPRQGSACVASSNPPRQRFDLEEHSGQLNLTRRLLSPIFSCQRPGRDLRISVTTDNHKSKRSYRYAMIASDMPCMKGSAHLSCLALSIHVMLF